MCVIVISIFRPAIKSLRPQPEPRNVEGRQEQQGQHGTDADAADQRAGDVGLGDAELAVAVVEHLDGSGKNRGVHPAGTSMNAEGIDISRSGRVHLGSLGIGVGSRVFSQSSRMLAQRH